ncbi:homeobox protein bagpipe-like [Heptranchias perlo]|uniref:homeobox protein bagpipe-like n=1 Tax=Heptranchias perlo TaxID=212740 RepID=UPI00355A0B9A
MEHQYPDYLPEIGAQDLQEDGYSREFLDYNRIDSEPIPFPCNQFPIDNRPSDHQSVGTQCPGGSGSRAGEVTDPGPALCEPPGLRRPSADYPHSVPSPVTSTTDTDQETDSKNLRPPKSRVRTVFSDEQKRRLMQQFHRQKYISPQERSELAKALGLNCKQVKTWYQNRRMKLKRSQYIQPLATSWNQSSFNPVSPPTLPLGHGLTPVLMKPHFISYKQQSMFSSGHVLPFRKQRPALQCPIVEVLQSAPIHGDPQYPAVSSYFQSSEPKGQPTNRPDPQFGDCPQECIVIPGAQSLGFRNQIPGMGHPAVGIFQSPSIQEDMQYIDHMGPQFNVETAGRELAASVQDLQIHPNNWCPVQGAGPPPGYITQAPVFDAYGVQQSGSADPFSENYIAALSGTL